jgi:hypothetical protein
VRSYPRGVACSNFGELLFSDVRCIESGPSLFIRDSWLFATLAATRRCWLEEVASLADEREIGKLLRGFFGRRAVRVVGVVAVLVVVVVLLFVVLNWYVGPKTPSVRKDLVVAVAQILGGTALLSGLYFTWRTLQVNRDKGHKLFEIRVGGIYALERIARESPEDYWPIMEVLTAYVRRNARWLPEEGQGGEAVSDVVRKSAEDPYISPSYELATTEVPTPDPDILAIMTVLRRRTGSLFHGEREALDLRETQLAGANLSEANLLGAWLFGANLSGAYIFVANLSRALLTRANLTAAYIFVANLSDAKLEEANLSGADLRGADVSVALHLTQEQLDVAKGDENTKLPPDLKPPAHWGVKTDEQTEGG